MAGLCSPNLYEAGVMLARLALYGTLGALLHMLGHSADSAEFWCFVALFWAAERVRETEVIQGLQDELTAMRRRAQQQEQDNNK